MPDTKTGREKKGLNKEAQLVARLYERELAGDSGEPPTPKANDAEFLTDDLPDD